MSESGTPELSERDMEMLGVNLLLEDTRREAVSLLEEHGVDTKLKRLKGTLIGAVSCLKRESPEKAKTRRTLDVVIPADTTVGIEKPLHVFITTAGKGSPVEAPRIDIKVDGAEIRAPFAPNTEDFPFEKDLGIDRNGIGTVRYRNILGESLEDSLPVSLRRAQSFRNVVDKAKTVITSSK